MGMPWRRVTFSQGEAPAHGPEPATPPPIPGSRVPLARRLSFSVPSQQLGTLTRGANCRSGTENQRAARRGARGRAPGHMSRNKKTGRRLIAPDPRSLGWALRDSNPQPRDYESPALTVAPRARYEKGGDRSRRQQLHGGDKGVRTPDLVTASHALSQLSYIPVRWCVSYISRLEFFVNTKIDKCWNSSKCRVRDAWPPYQLVCANHPSRDR